jgi:ATP-dependent Clp protease protease subunit
MTKVVKAMSKFWKFITNKSEDGQEENVELRIQGDIVSDDDVWIYEWLEMDHASPNAFRDELNEYDGKDITVWIDSYGGDVFAAAGIYNALKNHNGKITTKIDGKAMSAASVIAMAGDKVMMSPVAIMMIHNPLSSVQGYASDMRKQADVLDSVKESIVNAYQLKSGRSRNKISQMMDDETWMDANTAMKNGFADEMLYTDKEEDEPKNKAINFCFNRLAIQNCAKNSMQNLIKIEESRNIQEPKDDDIKVVLEKINDKFDKINDRLDKLEDKPPMEPGPKDEEKIKQLKAKLALKCRLL